jgi:23S rRNA (cytidine1920-2'-O)/16S rRNA (cytidine1409-2'-O)-methyltransferase
MKKESTRRDRRRAERPDRRRLDVLLMERGLCASRQDAVRLILAGNVRVAGVATAKPGCLVPADAALEVAGPAHPFVSRGGVKLQHALATFGVDPRGRICLDVGASTGGFSDCLLQAGARQVIAVDVGYGQLAERLRQDPRVQVLERTNIRYLEPSGLPASPDLATIDVSFISLRLVLPAVRRLLGPPADVVALVKPQFEVGRGQVGKGGVVRDPALHRSVLEGLAGAASDLGLRVLGLAASPLLGPMGNREFLLHLRPEGPAANVPALIAMALEPAVAAG